MSEKFSIEGLSAVREPTSVSFKKSNITKQERTMSGNLVVDYIATKNTVSVSWGVLTNAEFNELMSLLEEKRNSNSYFVITVVGTGIISPNTPTEDENASGGEISPVTEEYGQGVQELDLNENQSESADKGFLAENSSDEDKMKVDIITAYAEEVSYYPYFLADGSIVWRDVSINFSEV